MAGGGYFGSRWKGAFLFVALLDAMLCAPPEDSRVTAIAASPAAGLSDVPKRGPDRAGNLNGYGPATAPNLKPRPGSVDIDGKARAILRVELKCDP